MPYSKQDLQNLYSLSFEDVDATLAACGLSKEQDEYADEQIQSGFDVIRKYFNEAQVGDFAAATEMFSQQSLSKTKKTGGGKKSGNSSEQELGVTTVEDNDLDISQLLAQATSQCGTRISLNEASKILSACGLPDKEEYTGTECEVFVEACTLIKQQSKTYEEVAVHFGVATAPDDSLERQELLAEVQGIQGSVSSLSSTQTAQVMQALPQMSLEQLRAIKLQFLRDLNRELREYVESGRMQAEFQAAADTVIKDPFLTWSPVSDAKNRPLNGEVSQKSLPGN
ncbi:hypothetical protein [Chlorogloea sp. CCALA 695]|uniref:hypothetical protein n=1 Tax=Chlorogloea sp. CCALA 695 TaxID=2107693 RepID=UPI000D082A2E|nr:hypothetical protein [Chlorogloea sp. CCALA 695]PSB30098.1 hypothetical protein C7B70_17020 [Chlorogloea sp. CCALA 695]